MKIRILAPLLLLSALPAVGEPVDDLYRKGMLAAQEGDAETARSAFSEVLKLQPDHPYARYQLGQLEQSKDQLTATRRKKEIAAVTLPELDFHDAPFSDAIEVLGRMIEEESGADDTGKGLAPNFVVQDPTGALGKRPVSLQLKRIPASVALDYLLDQAGATARFEEHATVIRPAPTSGGPNAAK